MDSRDMWRFGRITARPSELIREHVFIAPYPEDDIRALVAAMGERRVLCGPDYPHPEGLAEPKTFAEKLAGLSDAEVRRIMRDNTAELLGLPSEFRRPLPRGGTSRSSRPGATAMARSISSTIPAVVAVLAVHAVRCPRARW